MSLRIAIFDDNKNIRESITMLLSTVPDLEVVGSFSHVLDCIEDVQDCNPDIVLMDIEMPGMTGIEGVRLIKKELPHVQVLMQTVFEDDDRVFDSICAGASGYILKNHLNTKLVESIMELQYGGFANVAVYRQESVRKVTANSSAYSSRRNTRLPANPTRKRGFVVHCKWTELQNDRRSAQYQL